ncbi:hypothetical protein FHL15_004211 [Xylaria flabelliformis]|uniref:Uncharacterized protein n=1 Tax=Xylaria flabelliformis TaxID=2512241 RepID=A0A553I3H7_9PEZI|nr:hypothetical protein FHL15_004211 [Xylaria flabelliformis]
MDDAEDKAEESEENISPDAEKSEIRFTLQRRRDRNGNNDNSGNERDSNRQGRNRGGDDSNQDRRSGREGDNGRNSRFRGGGDGGPPFFREENDGGGGKSGDNADGSGNGDGKEEGRDGGKGGNGRGGNNNNGQNKGDGGGGNNGGNGSGDNNDGGGKGGRGGRGGDGGRGGPGGDRGFDPGPPPLPPPPPPPSTTTTVESTTSEVSTTTSEVSTSTPAPEATTTTTSSVLQTSTIPILTPLPALADTAPTSPDPPILVPSEGALEPTPVLTSASVTDIADFTTLAPTQTNTNPANGSGRGNGRHRGSGDNNKGNDGEGGLNPTSERILIAAGAIGAFIVFLFIGWMVYRTLKKSKQPDRHDNKSWLSKLIPFRGRSAESNAKAPDNSYEPKESLPAYDFGNNNSMEAFGYYDQGKFAPFGSEAIMYQSTGTLQNGRVVWQTPEAQQPLQPQASLQNQYSGIADQMVDMNDVNSTMRSRPYYNQSEFARQPSDAYNPAQRQVYRASEISSLSSGFGDGDIIMPPPNIIPKPPRAPVTNNTETNNRPFSWMSRTGSVKKRETVSTTVSEQPIRFRSVNSWVDQQKERLRRANSRTRAREEVPAIPQISYK